MKISNFYAVIACVCALLSGAAAADDRVLLQQSGYIDRSMESSLLNAKELEQLAGWRSGSKSVHLVSIDYSAIETGTLVLAMPDGVLYRFVGTKADAKSQGFAGLFIWNGKARIEDPQAPTDTAAFSTDGKKAIAGHIHAAGRNYLMFRVNDRYQLLAESDPNRQLLDDTPGRSK